MVLGLQPIASGHTCARSPSRAFSGPVLQPPRHRLQSSRIWLDRCVWPAFKAGKLRVMEVKGPGHCRGWRKGGWNFPRLLRNPSLGFGESASEQGREKARQPTPVARTYSERASGEVLPHCVCWRVGWGVNRTAGAQYHPVQPWQGVGWFWERSVREKAGLNSLKWLVPWPPELLASPAACFCWLQ